MTKITEKPNIIELLPREEFSDIRSHAYFSKLVRWRQSNPEKTRYMFKLAQKLDEQKPPLSYEQLVQNHHRAEKELAEYLEWIENNPEKHREQEQKKTEAFLKEIEDFDAYMEKRIKEMEKQLSM